MGGKEEGKQGGQGRQASGFPTAAYLGLSGHAQEEAEGALQGGACPAS